MQNFFLKTFHFTFAVPFNSPKISQLRNVLVSFIDHKLLHLPTLFLTVHVFALPQCHVLRHSESQGDSYF